MEFHEKLIHLRRQRGLTQEELAAQLYVSRTAVSKWESGRGYPSIDSLKALSAFYGVTVDDLLSGEELLCAAQQEQKQKLACLRTRIFSALDISAVLLLFLPFFAQRAADTVQSVSLWALSDIQPYMKAAYTTVILLYVLHGLLSLFLHNRLPSPWAQNTSAVSLGIGALGVFLFILSPQPYAALFLFVLLAIKAFLMIKIP